jgi:predicted histone-like DNA-binding protein
MAIKFKTIQRGEPGVKGGGTKKYYATSVSQGEKTLDDLTKKIEKISTVSGADIRAVQYATVDVIVDDLADGYIVRIGELGSLRVSISSEGKDKEADITGNAVNNSRILFTPGSKLKEMLATLKFTKE